MNKKFSIITLTYNNFENTTLPYIKSLYANTPEEIFELIIVDNNSTDGTKEYLQELEKEKNNLKVIYNDSNQGYSKGNNQGIEIAKTDFIAFLNNDILLSPEWYTPLLEKLNDKQTGIVSAYAIQSAFVKEKDFAKAINKVQKEENYTETFKCEFSCAMIKRDLIKEVGMFDENFTPAYFEDDDFCVRVINSGYKNYICNTSFIYHKTSSTGKKLPECEKYYNKNKNYFIEKYKNNPFIKYSQQYLSEYNFIYPRYEQLKSYRSTSIKYWAEKVLRYITK